MLMRVIWLYILKRGAAAGAVYRKNLSGFRWIHQLLPVAFAFFSLGLGFLFP
jgi:hypothetical protein